MGQAIGQIGIVRPARRAVAARVSSGHIVMLLAGALGVLLTLSLLRSADDTTAVLVAARNLAPGTVVTDDAFRVARIHADDAVLQSFFDEADASAVRGQVVVTSVRPDEPLTRGVVRPASAQASARVMSFAIPRARAVGGALGRGDRVDVLSVEKDAPQAAYVLTAAEVVDIDAPSAGALGGVGDSVTVSLVVDAKRAPKLAIALEQGSVTLVRATGAPTLSEEAS
jgi:Flp pilus assembly protein CpaB